MNAKIVTLTLNPALDKSMQVEKLAPEQKLRCEKLRVDAGGGGINVSKAVRKLGGESVAVFPVGGHNGDVLCGLLEAAGVQICPVRIQSETRENIAVLETGTQAQYRFTLPGPAITPRDADACLEAIAAEKPEYLVASGSLPPGLPEAYFEKVAAFSKSIRAKLILDTSGAALCAAADEGLFC